MTRKKLKKLNKVLDRYELELKLTPVPVKIICGGHVHIDKATIIEHLLRSDKITMEEALKLMYP